MSVNRYLPHLYVLPEDDANRQIANGFILDHLVSTRKIQILREAGGWLNVVSAFNDDQAADMANYPERLIVLLIDFDGEENRSRQVKDSLQQELLDRVFVIGSLENPERLRASLNLSYEQIGLRIARNCRDADEPIWTHEGLRHNRDEMTRLKAKVRPFLFG